MNVIGKPRVWSFRCEMKGQFPPALDGRWYPCAAREEFAAA